MTNPTFAPSLPPPPPFDPQAPHHVVPDFLPDPLPLRACIDTHFDAPERAGLQHQVWNYWHVPDSYTYLRTSPDKVIDPVLMQGFMQRLSDLALQRLGMDHVTWPFLSLYVEGCGQVLHNDARNGAFGYVYSLTNWAERRFSGGETLIFREQDYWRSGRFREAGAGVAFYELIPALFNQLLLFDDRMVHGVPEVRGVKDPHQGRFVLHGHIEARAPHLFGALAQPQKSQTTELVLQIVEQSLDPLRRATQGQFHGFATYMVDIGADGKVIQLRNLVRRILSPAGPGSAGNLLKVLMQTIAALQLPPAQGPSKLVLPVFLT